MSIITERLLSQINEETLNERTKSRAEDEEKPANDAEATPSSAKSKTALEKIRAEAKKESIIVDRLIKKAYINKDERFSNIKEALKVYLEKIKKANSASEITDNDAIEEFKRINAVFLYQTGWDLFPETGNFTNLSLSPGKIGEVSKLLPKGRNWDSQASKGVYDNRKNKQKTLLHYWILINPTKTAIDKPHMILDKDGIRVVMAVKTKKRIVTKAAYLGKGAKLLNLPTDKNNLKLIDLINIAKAWDDFDEAALRADIEGTKIASKGNKKARRRKARRAAITAATKYNIRKAARDRWIGGYQNKLKSFYDKNAATKALASKYEAGKLTDGRYGYRTHYVTIKAADNIISQLNKFLNPKAAAKPAATPTPAATNERRVKQLSKLLETKLVGSELNLFNEQDTPAPDADKKRKLKALLAELQQIKGRLAAAHNQDSRPETDKEIDGKDLARFNEILSMLSWKERGEIDFNQVYKNMQPAVAAKEEPATEKEKVAQVARTIRGTCWFDFDPNTGGIRSGTPIEIWAAAGANFEEWYKQIVDLFGYEGASPQFNYKSGAAAQGRLKGAPSKLNDNKTQSISLDCLSVFMTKIADNFRRNGGIATTQLVQAKGTNDSANIKKVSDGAKYFLTEKGTYEGSIAHELEQVLNRVIAIIPSFKRGQIQQAMKTLADGNASDAAKQAAREVIARARRNEKAVAANAQRAQTRAATKPAGAAAAAKPAAAAIGTQKNPFKNQAAWSGWDSKTPAEQKKDNVVYFVYPGKDKEPLLQKIEYDANGKMKPTAPAAPATQQESLKQKREKLLNEAIFKKLVR